MNPAEYPSTRRDWEALQGQDYSISPNFRHHTADYPINDDDWPIDYACSTPISPKTTATSASPAWPAIRSIRRTIRPCPMCRWVAWVKKNARHGRVALDQVPDALRDGFDAFGKGQVIDDAAKGIDHVDRRCVRHLVVVRFARRGILEEGLE